MPGGIREGVGNPEIKMKKESCENCMYFRNDLECHRHAPRPRLSKIQGRIDWPVVSPRDWCGEFESKPTEVFEITGATGVGGSVPPIYSQSDAPPPQPPAIRRGPLTFGD